MMEQGRVDRLRNSRLSLVASWLRQSRVAVGGSRGRGGRAHQDVGDIPFRWLAGLVGRLRYLGQGAAAAVAFLEGGVSSCFAQK